MGGLMDPVLKAARTAARKHNEACVRIRCKVIELYLNDLERMGRPWPDGVELKEGQSYKDLLWVTLNDEGLFRFKLYFPSRGTGDRSAEGLYEELGEGDQLAVLLCLQRLWLKASASEANRLEDARRRLRSVAEGHY